MDTSIELDDVLESFIGTLLAGLVIVFVVLPVARRYELIPADRRRRRRRRRA